MIFPLSDVMVGVIDSFIVVVNNGGVDLILAVYPVFFGIIVLRNVYIVP